MKRNKQLTAVIFFILIFSLSGNIFSQTEENYLLELKNGSTIICHQISIRDNIFYAIAEDGSSINVLMNEVKMFKKLSTLQEITHEQEIIHGSKLLKQEADALNFHRKLTFTLKLAIISPGFAGILNYDISNFSVGIGGSADLNFASVGNRNAYKSGFIELKYNSNWKKSRRAFFFGDIGYADYYEHSGYDQDHGLMLNGGFGIMLPFSQNVHFVADVGYKAIINNNKKYDSSFNKKHTTVTIGIQF